METEEEVSEPQTGAPHPEVNGDLPGNPYLRDGALDAAGSPAREPAPPQCPPEFSPSHQCG